MRSLLSTLLAVALLAPALASCSSEGDDRFSVVATTNVLGDMVAQIAGTDAAVRVLLPIGVDPHEYVPSARQVAAVNQADLVVANGLGLEEGLEDILQAAAGDGTEVLMLAEQLNPIQFRGNGGSDPHVWFDPIRMAAGARLIGARLAALGVGADVEQRAEAYAAELVAADAGISEILSSISADRRVLVTNHDSLGYFAARYGFEIVGVVIPGGSTLADPSSAALSQLVAVIEELEVPAIFAETTEPGALAEAVASEADREVQVVELFTGSLGEPGSGADSLLGLLVTNAGRIAAALG